MDFYAVLARVIEILQQEGRTSYRALKRQFALDDEYLADLKVELIEVKQLAVDQNGTMLVWTGAAPPQRATQEVPLAPTATLPTALPERALAPIAAYVMSPGEPVARHQVGAEEKAARMAANQGPDRRAVRRDLAHLPFGRARVEGKLRITLQQRFQMIGMLRVAAHVGSDPVQVREQLQHPLQTHILFGLGPKLGRTGLHQPGKGSLPFLLIL